MEKKTFVYFSVQESSQQNIFSGLFWNDKTVL